MSHGQRTSMPTMNSIEDILERLLQYGAGITDKLENEVDQARGRTTTAPEDELADAPSSFELNAVASLESSFSSHKIKEEKEARTQKSPKDDISSDMLCPPSDCSATSDVTKMNNHFLGVESFPCFLQNDEGKMVEHKARVTFHRKAESSWLLVRFEVNDSSGKSVLVLRTELLGRLMKNTVINGKPVKPE